MMTQKNVPITCKNFTADATTPRATAKYVFLRLNSHDASDRGRAVKIQAIVNTILIFIYIVSFNEQKCS